MGGCGVDSCGSGFETMVHSCEYGNEPFGLKNYRNFLSNCGPMIFSRTVGIS
jgi:hypothetical protein